MNERCGPGAPPNECGDLGKIFEFADVRAVLYKLLPRGEKVFHFPFLNSSVNDRPGIFRCVKANNYLTQLFVSTYTGPTGRLPVGPVYVDTNKRGYCRTNR